MLLAQDIPEYSCLKFNCIKCIYCLAIAVSLITTGFHEISVSLFDTVLLWIENTQRIQSMLAGKAVLLRRKDNWK